MNGLPELSVDELAVIYSAAILADDDVSITVDKISTLLKAANVDVEPIWPTLYARALSGLNVRHLLTSTTVTTCGPGPTSAMASPAAPVKGSTATEPSKATGGAEATPAKGGDEEEDDDDDEDLGMNLFDFD